MSAAEPKSLPPEKRSPDDVLPSVEPPTAGFILQLFLIPLLIVSIIVVLWMLFSWLAEFGKSDPQALVREIKRTGNWQQAYELAGVLSSPDPASDELRQDSELAQSLAKLLQDDLDQPLSADVATNEPRIKLRMYLTRTLGWFETADSLPVLTQAVSQEKEPIEIDVRLSALESVAILAKQLGPEQIRANDALMTAVLDASRATDDAPASPETGYRPHGELRAVAAYSLGVIGGEEASRRLEIMLGDPYANARYNAVTGLCRLGDEGAIPGLAEMLDPDNDEAVKDESKETLQDRKRVQVLKSAMQATLELAEKNPQADLSSVKQALQKLAKSDLPKITARQVKIGLQLNAQETLKRLEAKPVPPTSNEGTH
jgi:hypothetical protein